MKKSDSKFKSGGKHKMNAQAKAGIKKQPRTNNLPSDVVKVAKGIKKDGAKKRYT